MAGGSGKSTNYEVDLMGMELAERDLDDAGDDIEDELDTLVQEMYLVLDQWTGLAAEAFAASWAQVSADLTDLLEAYRRMAAAQVQIQAIYRAADDAVVAECS